MTPSIKKIWYSSKPQSFGQDNITDEQAFDQLVSLIKESN